MEVLDWKWMSPRKLTAELQAHPGRYTYWLRVAWQELLTRGHVPAARVRPLVPGTSVAHPDVTAILHSFSSGPGLLRAGLVHRHYVSFSGMVTFKNWHLDEAIRQTPPVGVSEPICGVSAAPPRLRRR